MDGKGYGKGFGIRKFTKLLVVFVEALEQYRTFCEGKVKIFNSKFEFLDLQFRAASFVSHIALNLEILLQIQGLEGGFFKTYHGLNNLNPNLGNANSHSDTT